MGYIKVSTFTNPEAVPVKRAIEALGFSQPYISSLIREGKLDHGFTFDRGRGGTDSGELLVILNQKYFNALEARKQKVKEMLFKDRLSIQEATILTGKPEPELIQLIASGFLTYEMDASVMSGYLARDENLESLIKKES